VINLGKAPKEFYTLYFPLSPKYAFKISSQTKYSGRTSLVEKNEVNQLNIEMAKQADKMIFANSRQLVQSYKPYINA